MYLNFSDMPIKIDKTKKSIFLAGPTLRNDSFNNSWRKVACEILDNLEFDGIVYIPEYSKSENPMDFMNQVEWERDGLCNADIILFHIPRKLPELPGFTTNIEFGLYLARRPDNIYLCCPPNSEKNRYIEWLYNKEIPNGIIYKDLEKVLKEIVAKLKAE